MRFGRSATAMLACLVALVPAVSAVQRVTAQDGTVTCTREAEPNDTPDASPVVSGPFCLEGTLPSQDQDLIRWELPEAAAATPWRVSVQGVPGALTGLKILTIASEPGISPIIAGPQVLEVAAPPTATDPVATDPVLLPTGTLILGISRSDAGDGRTLPSLDYRFSLEPLSPLAAVTEVEPNDDAASATPIAGETAIAGDASGSWDWYAWDVGGTPADQAWQVALQGVVGSPVTMTLRDPDGEDVATAGLDALGYAMLPDLQLRPGTWLLGVFWGPDQPSPYAITTTLGPRLGDAEPNDPTSRAIAFDPGTGTARGRLAPAGDRDRYRLTIPAADPRILRDLKLLGGGDLRRTLCLGTADGLDIQCRDGLGAVALRSLVLAPGDYLVTVGGDASADDPYVLRLDTIADPVPDFEQEPNDEPSMATPFDPSIAMRGLATIGDRDVFSLDVAGDAQLWEVRLSGTQVSRLAWIRPDWMTYAEGSVAADRSAATLTDLYLVPGRHWFRVEGDGDYVLTVTPLGPPDPNQERESNDSPSFAQPYRLGRADVVGRLPSTADVDFFRFTLAGEERVTLVAEPPMDGSVGIEVIDAGSSTIGEVHPRTPGVASSLELLVGPGDYLVQLRPDQPSLGRYRLRLERGDPFPVRADEEPNLTPQTAQPVPPSLSLTGTSPDGDGLDWYRLPPLDPTTPLTITLTGSISSVRVSDGTTDLPMSWDAAGLAATTDGTSGLVPRYLVVSGAIGAYTLSISAPGLEPDADPVPPPVSMTLVPEAAEVGAYWAAGQSTSADLLLTNQGDEAVSLTLDVATSHFGWSATPAEASVALGPGETRTVGVAIAIAPDAWADEPVRITARARGDDGGAVTAATVITPRADTDPLRPHQAWTVPDAVLGGLDVAALALGATTIPAYDQAMEDQLHDGFAHTGMGLARPVAELPVDLRVDLAGDAPIPVVAFAVNPQGYDALPGDAPLDVELLLTSDGSTWQSAATVQLTTLMADQWFVLPAPVEATQARLRITSTHGGGFARVVLGEWKVIARPGFMPLARIDLAQPAAGGHVAWMEPQAADEQTGPSWLDEAPDFVQLSLESATSVSWAMGFRDARAAQLTSLEWVDPVPSTEGQRFTRLEVALSLDGAAGPWTSVGTWTLDRAADGTVSPFVFPEPTWARYVRFTGSGPRKAWSPWDPPSTIRAIERPTDAAYRSAVGEWGAGMSVGPREWLEPPDLSVPPSPPDHDDTPETATTLAPGASTAGRMGTRTDVDWYQVTVPDDQNTLEVTVTGWPLVGVALTLTDADGLQVPMLFSPGDRPGTVRYAAEVDPGETYRIEVRQPPSSIVLTFDTSGSLGPYLDYIYQAIRAFTADVTPGEEFVRIVPFEEQPLLDDWSDDPWALQDAVGRYVGAGGSSSAETALIEATTALSAREGARAILVVTDAETSSFPRQAELWRIFGAVRPMVAAVQVAATGAPAVSSGYMHDWAMVANGFYQYARSHGEMDRAFDRLATWLRRPASYRMDVATAFREKPPASRKPGTITVTAPKDGVAALSPDVGLEIILDTSGSMLKAIKGQPRIVLAKRVLTDLVTNQLPAGAPLAVRVLGDADDVCGTNLVAPLAPLDAASVVARVEAVDVVQEADTPLGQALRAVPDDLAGSTGTRIVLLITDSEEVWPHPDLCGEDPAAAIRDLRRRGIDARLNIVGLQVDAKKATQQLRRWARLGNGSFFAARDAEQLGRSIRTAVSAPFRILDAAGNEVASGTVGGTGVPVPPGTYAVVVLTDPVARFDAIEVGPGDSETLQLPDPTPPPSLEPLPDAAP